MKSTGEFIIRGTLLCKYVGSGGSVVIPEGITQIDRCAFQRSAVTQVTIPDTVTSIGELAFGQCAALTSISIPDSVTAMDMGILKDCTGLTSLKLPGQLTKIPSYAFCHCQSLTEIEIPDSVTEIGAYAFDGCENLATVSIPQGITSIQPATFQGCRSLTSLRIPDGITGIGDLAFSGCAALTDLQIPAHIRSFGSFAFACCPGLAGEEGFTILNGVLIRYEGDAEELTVPQGVTTIDSSAFANCKNLKSLHLPDSLTTIGHSAFFRCDALASLRIPAGVRSIGTWAFRECSSLTSMILPEDLQALGKGPFSECKKLATLSLPEGLLRDEKFYLGDKLSLGLVLTGGEQPRFLGYTSKCGPDSYGELIRKGKWKAWDQDLLGSTPVYKHKAPARLLGSLGRLADPVDLTEASRAQHLEFLIKNAKKLIPIAQELACPALVEAMISLGVINPQNKKAMAKLLEASAQPEIAAFAGAVLALS